MKEFLAEPAVAGKHVRQRRTPRPEDLVLSAQAAALLQSIDAEHRPARLAERFPRIVNHMSRIWADRGAMDRYLTELLIDHRGDRQGFPFDIVLELMGLRDYYDGLGTPAAVTGINIPGFVDTPTMARRAR